MAQKKIYARYIFNRGLETLWRGDAAEKGSIFRSVVATSDDFNSTQGTFQVYALEGIGQGVKDGKFAGSDNKPKILFDGDFRGLGEAVKKYQQLIQEAVGEGFKPFSFMDLIEFEQKARASQNK